MKDNRDSFVKGETERLFSTDTLNLNTKDKLSCKERRNLILDSKLFTAVATVCTLGTYYLYYLFCLEKAHDSPFVESTRRKDKYTFERNYKNSNVFKEASLINKELAAIVSSKNGPNKSKEIIQAQAKTNVNKVKLFGFHCLYSAFNWFDKFLLIISKGNLEINSAEKLRQEYSEGFREQEGKIKELINNKLQDYSDTRSDFVSSFLEDNPKTRRDHYLVFLFVVSYILFSVVTLGLFPVYHICIKDRRHDFRNIFNHRKHTYAAEFDDVTEKLLGVGGKLEYSLLLLGRRDLPLRINDLSDAFRTQAFRSWRIRGKLITFLMIITLGLFGVFVLSKNVFDNDRLSIDHEDSTVTDYSKACRNIDKFKLFLIDLYRDLRVAVKIAARKVSFINKSLQTSFEVNEKQDKSIFRLVKGFSSPLYFWLFAMFATFGSLIAVCACITQSETWYNDSSFWFIVVSWVTFLALFTRHIKLLFS